VRKKKEKQKNRYSIEIVQKVFKGGAELFMFATQGQSKRLFL
jgi:hypothetical protein